MQETGEGVKNGGFVLFFANVSYQGFSERIRAHISERDADGSDERAFGFEEKALLTGFIDDPKRGDIVEGIEFLPHRKAVFCEGTVECSRGFAAMEKGDGSKEDEGDRHNGAVFDEGVDHHTEEDEYEEERRARR